MYKKFGRAPGIMVFCRESGVRKQDIYFHWMFFDDLVRQAGGTPNKVPTPITDDEILRAYLACIGPAFRETDLAALRNCFGQSTLAGVTLLSAAALRRIVEESIRHRASFRLAELEAQVAGYNLLVDERAVETWFSLPEELRARRAGA